MPRKFIDEKVTIWRRSYFSDEVTNESIIEELNKVENVLYISDIEGFIESEILFDTEESLSVKENKGKATIQFFLRAEDDEIWSNEED